MTAEHMHVTADFDAVLSDPDGRCPCCVRIAIDALTTERDALRDRLADAAYRVIHRECPRCLDDPQVIAADQDADVRCPTCMDTRSIGPVWDNAEDVAGAIADAVMPIVDALTADRDRARRMERAANEIEGLADKVEAALGDDGGLTEKLLLAERRAALEGAITAVTEQQIEDAARHADDPQHGHGSWCHRGASTTCHGAEADATHNRVLDVLRGLLAALNPEGDDDRG